MNDKKNILILATTPFIKDGLTKIEMDVYRFCRNDMHISFATAFSEDNSYSEQLRKDGVTIYKLKPKRNVPLYMYSIWKLIREHDFDAVYIHGNSAMMLIEALPCKLGGAKRIITHCHNTESKYDIIHRAFKPLFNLIVDEKIGCSGLAARFAYYRNYKVILNGADTDKFRFCPNMRDETRRELNWENRFIIGHIGRFVPQKNHDFIIDVFSEIEKRDENARLLLIGDGVLQQQIYEKAESLGIADKVCFMGVTDCAEKYINAMDVFLMPSLYEGLSLVALEAQANGLPVILSTRFAKETFVSDNAVKLSLERKPEKWAEAILKMKGKPRIDTGKAFTERKMDINCMLRKIYLILSAD